MEDKVSDSSPMKSSLLQKPFDRRRSDQVARNNQPRVSPASSLANHLQNSGRKLASQLLKLMKSNSNSVLPNLNSASVNYQNSSQILNLTPDTSRHVKPSPPRNIHTEVMINQNVPNHQIYKTKGITTVPSTQY